MGKNRIVRNVAPKSIFAAADAVTGTGSYEQGDLLIFDDSANVIRKPTTEAECATILGIAVESVVSGKLKGPYPGLTDVDAAGAISSLPGPVYGVVAKLVLKTGDSLSPGDLVYGDPASGTANVQAAGTKAIGIYQGKAVSSAAAGLEIEVLLGARHPGDTLRF